MASMDTGAVDEWRLGYRPALDGVRGIACLMVFAGHAGWPVAHNAAHQWGVEAFFVLSGFLITSLLLDEAARSGRVSLGAFYLRRARRLLPAMLAMVALTTLAALVTGLFRRDATIRGALTVLTYTTNMASVAGWDVGPFAHLWSLAVEEHFYLVWPVLVALIVRLAPRRRPEIVACASLLLVCATVLWRWRLVHVGSGRTWQRMYTATDVRSLAPLLGGLLAARLRLAGSWVKSAAVPAAIGGVSALLWLSGNPSVAKLPRIWLVALPLAAGAGALLCVAGSVGDNGATRVLSIRSLRSIGKLSYAAYLWHYPIFLWIGGTLTTMSTIETGLAVGLTFVCASLSDRFIESRFRKHLRGPFEGPNPGWRPNLAALTKRGSAVR
jgi:peptidoglycan/LPS O-acetylase OafA/YrhL